MGTLNGLLALGALGLMLVGGFSVLRWLFWTILEWWAGPVAYVPSDPEMTRLQRANAEFHGEIQTARQHLAILTGERDAAEAAAADLDARCQQIEAERARLAERCRILETTPPPPSAADTAELSRLRGRVSTLTQEMETLRAELADTTPDAVWRQRFKRTKLRFATTFHPDNTRDKPDAPAREAAFKLFWPELEKIARES